MELLLRCGDRVFQITCTRDTRYPMWVAEVVELRPDLGRVVWDDVAIRRVECHEAAGAAVEQVVKALGVERAAPQELAERSRLEAITY